MSEFYYRFNVKFIAEFITLSLPVSWSGFQSHRTDHAALTVTLMCAIKM